MTFELIQGDAMTRTRELPGQSFDCCVTSPPYWLLRDYQVRGQLGIERRLTDYVERLVATFDEVRRVLRPHATLWVNIGDTYASGKGRRFNPGGGKKSRASITERKARGAYLNDRLNVSELRNQGLKPKDLCMVPARFALAMQARGWWLRSQIVWHKRAHATESVRDRPTQATEFIYLFTRSRNYFYDRVGRKHQPDSVARAQRGRSDGYKYADGGPGNQTLYRNMTRALHPRGANFANCWNDLSRSTASKQHFATFPLMLPLRCLRLGTSRGGYCSACGMPYVRSDEGLAWSATCDCLQPPRGGRVLDPFCGTGTAGVACALLELDFVGIDLSPNYLAEARERIATEPSRLQRRREERRRTASQPGQLTFPVDRELAEGHRQ